MTIIKMIIILFKSHFLILIQLIQLMIIRGIEGEIQIIMIIKEINGKIQIMIVIMIIHG